ncbi:MAG: hypothetical protein ABFD18_18355 [Syntrophomonas sp.]
MVDLIVGLFGLVILFFLCIIGLVLYIFKSIGFMAMASNKGMENAWLAWIPIADLYIAGKIVEEVDFFGVRITNLGLWLPIIMVADAFLAFVPVINIICLVIFVFFLFYLYRLFSIYKPSQATLFTVFSIIGIWPIFVFAIRNNQPVIEQETVVEQSPVADQTPPPVDESITPE